MAGGRGTADSAGGAEGGVKTRGGGGRFLRHDRTDRPGPENRAAPPARRPHRPVRGRPTRPPHGSDAMPTPASPMSGNPISGATVPGATARLIAAAAVCGGGAVAALGLTGCQASIAGQTLPSPYYLRDDVQFFPPGPEFQFSNQVQAIEEYQLRGVGGGADGVADPVGPIN